MSDAQWPFRHGTSSNALAFVEAELAHRVALRREYDTVAMSQRLSRLNLRTVQGPALSEAEAAEHALLRQLLPIRTWEQIDTLMRLRWLRRKPGTPPKPEVRVIGPGTLAVYAAGECIGYMEGKPGEDLPWFGRVGWRPLSPDPSERGQIRHFQAKSGGTARAALLRAARKMISDGALPELLNPPGAPAGRA